MGVDDYSSSSYRDYGRKVEVMNGRGPYAANRAYIGKSQRSNYTNDHYDVTTTKKSSSSGSFFNNREMQRRKRVVTYKWYAVEGKIKASLKNGLRVFKRKCTQIIHGF